MKIFWVKLRQFAILGLIHLKTKFCIALQAQILPFSNVVVDRILTKPLLSSMQHQLQLSEDTSLAAPGALAHRLQHQPPANSKMAAWGP